MTSMARRATAKDLSAMADLAARCQVDPATHVIYLGLDADSIASDIEDYAGWTGATVVADERDGGLAGWLLAHVDVAMGRLFWWGPFVDRAPAESAWDELADELYRACRAMIPASVDEEEACGDDRGDPIRRWCVRHGLEADPASVLLRRDPPPSSREGAADPDPRVRPMAERDHAAVRALHAEAFLGAHASPEALVASDERRLVIDLDGAPGGVSGYVAVEHQSDGSGCIDFLAVIPAMRGRGLGRALVEAACHRLFAEGATHVHLTVREDNAAARALYAPVGFIEDRLARPYRRGFRLR